jgi:glutamyl-tRNA synthetase
MWDQTDFFFKAPESYDPEAVKKRWKEDSASMLNSLADEINRVDDFTPISTDLAIKAWIEKNGLNTGAVMNALRLVIVGSLRGPHMADIICWLGREETIHRIKKGISVLGK